MKRTLVGLILLFVVFVLGLVACGQEPETVVETVTVEVTRVVEVVETVTVEVTRVVEVEVTPEPSEADLATEKFADETGFSTEVVVEILAGTHPTLTYLLVEGGEATADQADLQSGAENTVGVTAFCSPNGEYGNYFMAFENLHTAEVKSNMESALEGWILLLGEFSRMNSLEPVDGIAWVYGPYIAENGPAWSPELSANPMAPDTISTLPGCEMETAFQVYETWDDATAAWEKMEDAGAVACEQTSRYLVQADTYVSVTCTSNNQLPVSFQFQNGAPKEINQIIYGTTTSYELTWVFSPNDPVATGRMIAYDADGRLVVQFPGLSPNEYWISRD